VRVRQWFAVLLVACVSSVLLTAQPTTSEAQKIDEFRAWLKAIEPRLTSSGITNARTISSRLATLKTQFKPVVIVPPPPPPPPVEVCNGVDDNGDGRIDEGCPPPSTMEWSFTAENPTIPAGQSTKLIFTTPSDVHRLTINGLQPTISCIPTTGCAGSLTVSPIQTATYVLKSSNAAGVAWPELSVTVTVTGVVPTPTPTPTPDPTPTPIPPPTGGSNAYFDDLVARSDFWKAYSLRDPKQLTYKNQGGYSDTNSTSSPNVLWVTYDATVDAAKVTIPAFVPGCSLTASVSAADTVLPISCGTVSYWNGGTKRAVRVDQEIMAIIPPVAGAPPNTLTVTRGAFGTSAFSHASGANAEWNTNSLRSQVLLPLGTTDGFSYLFTWDGLWTDSYLNSGLSNHKAFQFGSDGVWFEPQTGFDGARKVGFTQTTDVAVVTARTYNWIGGPADWATTDGNAAGPGVLTDNYITPRLAMPTIAPNRWTRFWVVIEQRANDYERVSLWVADEQNAPVQVYKDLLVSVRPKVNTVQNFWLEFNTSTDSYVRGLGARDFVSYVKNVVALKGALGTDWSSVLQKPIK
jgi:hypothetical protein